VLIDRICHGRSKALLLWVGALIAACSWALVRMPFDWVPLLELPQVTVFAAWPGASQEVVEKRVTSMIERAVQQIAGTERVESVTWAGAATVRVSVSHWRSADLYAIELGEHLTALEPVLPEGSALNLTREIPQALRDNQSFMTLQLVASLPPMRLRQLAETAVAPRLRRHPGVAEVMTEGGHERELLVTAEADRLEASGVPPWEIRRWLGAILAGRSYGSLSGSSRNILLRRSQEIELPGLCSGALDTAGAGDRGHPLRLADLARLELKEAPVRTISRIDGKPVVTLTLDRSPGSHLLRVARNIRRVIEEIQRDLPSGTELLIADDRSEDIHERLRDLVLRGGLGLALVLLILTVMLRSGRAVGITLLVVLVALSAAILFFQPLRLSLNVLTLAGLMLLFGLLVDNAVVLIERLQAGLETRRGGYVPYATAAGRVVRAMWLPLLGGTLTTCVVFLPMVYLSGELRMLFAPFAVLSALTLGFSLVASILLVSNLGRGLCRRVPRQVTTPSRIRTWFLLPNLFSTRHPRLTVLLIALAIGLPTPLLPDHIEEPTEGWQSQLRRRFAERYNATLGSDRFREARLWLDPSLGGVTRPFLKNVEFGKRWDFNERPEIRVWLKLPPGSSIERIDESIRLFEQEALTSPAVKRTLVNVREREAILRVLFRDEAMGTSEPYVLRERLVANALQIAGIEISITGLVPMGFYTGLGEVAGFTVQAFGPSYEKLEEVSQDFARNLERYPRVAEVDVNAAAYGQPPAREAIRVHWDADAVTRTGLSARELAEVLRQRLWRGTPDFYADFEGDSRMPVRMVMEGAEALDLETLLDTPLAARNGGPISLADHAELFLEKDPPIIERINQQYRRTLRVYYRGPHRLGREMLDEAIAGLTLSPGYRLERPKYEFFTEEVQREFFWLILGTLALVFLVIAAVLESWRLAAVVMLSVPLSWIGVALGFLISGQNFAEGAFLGSLLTIGVSVNQAILLADAYRRLRQARPGFPGPRLALLALRQRLRPMWTTTLTSIASMLPLLVLPDAGNFWVGLAVTVVGGLLASTLLGPAATIAVLSWASCGWASHQRRATRSHRELVPAG
jgi:multidrug efflux pump subunit AcrB